MEQHVYCLLVLSLGARTRSPCPITLQRGDIATWIFPKKLRAHPALLFLQLGVDLWVIRKEAVLVSEKVY